MNGNATTNSYRRRVTPVERLFTRSPFSTVSMVARIRGDVTSEALAMAVDKVQLRHPHLRVRIVDDNQHNSWFTSEGAGPIPIEVIPRGSGEQWMETVQNGSTVPFEFESGPPIRFILLRSAEVSELVIMCHHIICDGMSLAYLARDLLNHLGDPSQEVVVLPDPAPVSAATMPESLSVNPLVRSLIRRINRKWQKDPVFFDQQDYELLADAYWQTYEHRMATIELSIADTDEIVNRCRQERVTVNTALAAAFAGAQALVLGPSKYHADVGVGVDLRPRLRHNADEVMGFFAGVATQQYEHDAKLGFWENARRLHPKLRARFTDKALFKDALVWGELDPTILEAINFKKLGGLVRSDGAGSKKIHDFSQRSDVVLGILKRDKMESLERIMMGTAITNLTRLDFPTTYGSLQLERLIMKPGGAFPLVNVNLVVGAATAAGRLSLLLEYVEDNINAETMETIKKHALEFLFD